MDSSRDVGLLRGLGSRHRGRRDGDRRGNRPMTPLDLRAVEGKLVSGYYSATTSADIVALLAEVRALRQALISRCQFCHDGLPIVKGEPEPWHMPAYVGWRICTLTYEERATLARVTDDATETG